MRENLSSPNFDVAIIEDHVETAELLATVLSRRLGISPAVFTSLDEYLEFRQKNKQAVVHIKLLIADVMLGSETIFERCLSKDLTSLKAVAGRVMVVSGLDSSEYLEAAYNFGADDYMTKPIGFSEFVHRAKLLMDQVASDADGSQPPLLNQGELSFGTCRVKLTKTESKIFELILAAYAGGRALQKKTAEIKVWNGKSKGGCKTFDVHLCAIRKKIAAHDWYIDCVYGQQAYQLRKGL